MARPRRSDGTKELLLEEGVRVLSSRGYNGTGLKEILDAVNVPKGSFYNFFESKEAFAAAIIDRYIDARMAEFDAYAARSKKPPLVIVKKVYAALIVELADQKCLEGCLLGNMAAEVGATSTLCQAALRRAVDRWKTRFVKLLERGQAEGSVRADVPASVLADVLWNAWEGGILRMKLDGDTASLKRTIDVLADSLFARSAA